jgi:hypothetical protein
MEEINGKNTNPSVIRESRYPSLSTSENGVSADITLNIMLSEISKRGMLFLLHMSYTLGEQGDDMRIGNAVIDFLAVAARGDDTSLS